MPLSAERVVGHEFKAVPGTGQAFVAGIGDCYHFTQGKGYCNRPAAEHEPEGAQIIDPYAKCCCCGLFCLAVFLPDGRRCCHECYGKVTREVSR